MKTIKIKTELEQWLTNYITESVHGMKAENSNEFNRWAKSFKKEEAEFLVGMEFCNDWGYDEREEINEEEAIEYGNTLLKVVLDNWYR